MEQSLRHRITELLEEQKTLRRETLEAIAGLDLQKLEAFYSRTSEPERDWIMKAAMKEVARSRGWM